MKSVYEWIINSFLKSRKFWIAVIGFTATFLSDKLGLDQEQLYGILVVIVSMITGIAIEDAGAKKAAADVKLAELKGKNDATVKLQDK